ncbi:MAG: DUF134 domain-containing protein [Epulopiscium sp.]|nr:DUF134 domain-containing protein [Candidatus Epulonipiscium sp.]
MARPIKCRKIEFFLESRHFMPIEKENHGIGKVVLKLEELEAMRLKDIEGLSQEESAIKMNISRQTFQNIIDSARKKIAIALTEGRSIHIRGGNYTFGSCIVRCLSCGEIYSVEYERNEHNCPSCNSSKIICKKRNRFCENLNSD